MNSDITGLTTYISSEAVSTYKKMYELQKKIKKVKEITYLSK